MNILLNNHLIFFLYEMQNYEELSLKMFLSDQHFKT